MTPEEKAEFVKLPPGPQRLGRHRLGGRLHDLVRLDDGNIGFVPNALDAEISQAPAEAIEELFPEPAKDRP
jgi:hypothetical protein